MTDDNSNSRTFLSDAEREMLSEICSKYGLQASDVEDLLNLERDKQSMGRRRGIHLQIREHVERISERATTE